LGDGFERRDVYLVCFAYSTVRFLPLNELKNLHFTPYSFSIFSASAIAFLLLLYQIATFAPASANAWATANPIPAPAPETIAVRPAREKSGRTRLEVGAIVLLCLKAFPSTVPSIVMISASTRGFLLYKTGGRLVPSKMSDTSSSERKKRGQLAGLEWQIHPLSLYRIADIKYIQATGTTRIWVLPSAPSLKLMRPNRVNAIFGGALL
jgi:hypothetical protein